jgi:hypothetical protein
MSQMKLEDVHPVLGEVLAVYDAFHREGFLHEELSVGRYRDGRLFVRAGRWYAFCEPLTGDKYAFAKHARVAWEAEWDKARVVWNGASQVERKLHFLQSCIFATYAQMGYYSTEKVIRLLIACVDEAGVLYPENTNS